MAWTWCLNTRRARHNPLPGKPGISSKPASSGERKILYWYDPMHPAYKANKAGIAPDCGMDLVPKYADEDANAMAAGTVKIAPDRQQLIGVRTSTVTREPLMRSVRTTGQVIADETKVEHVHVKISGFIDKVYVNYIGQLVKKGQPLFTVYSPDLVATEEEYLIAKRGEKKSRRFRVQGGLARRAGVTALRPRAPQTLGHHRRANQETRRKRRGQPHPDVLLAGGGLCDGSQSISADFNHAGYGHLSGHGLVEGLGSRRRIRVRSAIREGGPERRRCI